MYQNIAVAVDNSEQARCSENLAVMIARHCTANLTGCHVYSGKFHRMRFQALEEYLPPQYQKEDILAYQRSIHSVLIERGLEIISSEYMKRLRDLCREQEVPFREMVIDGKRSDVLCDITGGQDLIVLGSQGIGRIAGVEGLGSTAERVLSCSSCDVLLVRNDAEPRNILVGIDGSEFSFSALRRALEIGKMFDAAVTLLAAHNPRLHRSVFDLLSGVLSREAGEVFRFNEQEQLHNMIIDRSLEDLYQQQLDRGVALAEPYGISPRTQLGEGTPWYALCTELQNEPYDLVVVGRYGMHRGRCDQIGSNSSRVAHRAPVNVLVVGGYDVPKPSETMMISAAAPADDIPALVWTDAAKKRLERIPSFARPMAMLGIERYARENGLGTITPEIMAAAREKLGL